jgi:Uncharacterized conserved protein
MKQWVVLLLSASFFSLNSRAQQLNMHRDFVLVPGGSDTVAVISSDGSEPDYQEKMVAYQLNSFHISRTCVSVSDYARFCRALHKNMPAPPAWGWGDLKKPMVNVSYQDALEYCRYLTELWGVPVRLAAKDEWVYASFSGRFVNHLTGGYTVLPDIEKYAAFNNGKQANEQPVCITCRQPNDLGIYNMWGNVWEWVDGWHHTPGDTDTSSSRKMIIGGSFRSPREDMHSEATQMLPVTYRSDEIGFRVVINITNNP